MLLIDRSRPGITVTAFGERILVYAREMLRYEEAIRQEAAAAKGLAIGKLWIGSISSVATRWLPGLLAAFLRRYPGIDLCTAGRSMGGRASKSLNVHHIAKKCSQRIGVEIGCPRPGMKRSDQCQEEYHAHAT